MRRIGLTKGLKRVLREWETAKQNQRRVWSQELKVEREWENLLGYFHPFSLSLIRFFSLWVFGAFKLSSVSHIIHFKFKKKKKLEAGFQDSAKAKRWRTHEERDLLIFLVRKKNGSLVAAIDGSWRKKRDVFGHACYIRRESEGEKLTP